MRVLVLGAGGYLGSALVSRFVAAGYTVSGLVRNIPAAEKLELAGAQPVSGDLEDFTTYGTLLDRADVIIFAAQLLLKPERHTVESILELLEGSGKTFVFTSGTGVLAQRTDGKWSEDSFSEDDDFVASKYIGARLDTENLVRAAGERGIRGIVVRPAMIWGHGRCPMIKSLYQSAALTDTVCYLGPGLNLYSNVHVDDVAEVYHLAIDKGKSGALYPAVSGETNFRTLAEAVARELDLPTRSVDLAEAVAIWGRSTALIIFSVCSRSRAPRSRSELGWRPDPGRLDILEDIRHPTLPTSQR